MLVSVVIPTYNPGPYLDPGLESLLGQTLPADQFEIIVVDDGSTDDTPAHLDALAARHPNVVVVHSEHSGWAGRPRNIGIKRARGEFIQFMDQDDRMAPDALRRLVEIGQRNHSDIVLGKVTSDFRGVALDIYRETRDVCTIHDSAIISSLTPHKMFRRSFLHEHGILFPEGKRRLEDQLFVVKAYFAARVISILADEPCYFYLRRDDRGNAGSNPTWDPAGYYANLREVLDVVVANTQPGEQRAHLMRRFCRAQLVGRVGGPRLLAWEPDFRAEVFANVRGVMVDYVDPSVDASLGAVMAVKAGLIRADRLDALVELAQRMSQLAAPSRIDSARWVGGSLEVAFSAEIEHLDGTPFVFGRRAGRTVLDPALTRDILPEPIDVTTELRTIRLSTAVRERASSVEWRASTKLTVTPTELGTRGDGWENVRLTFHGVARLDPELAAGGRPLAPGQWVWRTRLAAFGINLEAPLGAATPADRGSLTQRPLFHLPDHLVTPHLAAGAGATLEVVQVAEPPPDRAVYRRPTGALWTARATARRLGRGVLRRLPPAMRDRSRAAYRAVRSVVR